jgi:MoxR-like ATPase
VPGVGKTPLAMALGKVTGLAVQRIQFTADLLPADVVGVSVFEGATQTFRFHPGPIFAPVVLADEINRASPKTQSALLEAMEERQVTVEGETRPLPAPFFVLATQNPRTQLGVFPLPESQLDRFLMCISLGYPPAEAERALLAEVDRRSLLDAQAPMLDGPQLLRMQAAVADVTTRPALLDYILALVHATRAHAGLRHGVSPRAGLALKRAAQAWAFLHGRAGVLPEDVQAVFAAVIDHRLLAAPDAGNRAPDAAALLATVAIP